MTPLPPIGELLPHGPPMRLVDELVECAGGTARCRLRLRPDSPFMEAGRVRALVSLEYMGQAAAACAGLAARAHPDGARRPAPGLLLGTRELELAVPYFSAGDELTIEAERLDEQDGIARFRCEVRRGGARVAAAVLTVYLPHSRGGGA